MNTIDHDKEKFDVDEYGNLIPKEEISADERYGRKLDEDD